VPGAQISATSSSSAQALSPMSVRGNSSRQAQRPGLPETSNVRRRFSDNPQGGRCDARDALNAAQNNSKLRCGQMLRCLSQAAMYCSGILRVRTPGTVLIDTRYPHRSHHQRTSPRRFGEYSGSCPFGHSVPTVFISAWCEPYGRRVRLMPGLHLER
jgi:hypothetical protein